MEELKKCPFCGGEAVFGRPNMHGLTNIFCKQCGVETPWGKPKELSAAWNRRPSPENNPLTLDKLREMNGEPVYIVEGSKAKGHWELSEDAYDYFDDRDPDFYGMRYDDPDGHFRLHVLGWEAYSHKPEGAEKE